MTNRWLIETEPFDRQVSNVTCFYSFFFSTIICFDTILLWYFHKFLHPTKPCQCRKSMACIHVVTASLHTDRFLCEDRGGPKEKMPVSQTENPSDSCLTRRIMQVRYGNPEKSLVVRYLFRQSQPYVTSGLMKPRDTRSEVFRPSGRPGPCHDHEVAAGALPWGCARRDSIEGIRWQLSIPGFLGMVHSSLPAGRRAMAVLM